MKQNKIIKTHFTYTFFSLMTDFPPQLDIDFRLIEHFNRLFSQIFLLKSMQMHNSVNATAHIYKTGSTMSLALAENKMTEFHIRNPKVEETFNSYMCCIFRT